MQDRPFGLSQGEFVLRYAFVDVHFDHVNHNRIFVFGAVDLDVFRKGDVVVCLPIAVSRIGQNIAASNI